MHQHPNESFIPEQSRPSRQKIGRALRRRAQKWPAIPWKPSTQHVNNVIYRCHLEKIGFGCLNRLSTDMRGVSITIFICTAKLSPRMGLCSGGLRVDPKQTHILKQDLEYNLNNNGFTRQEAFPPFSQALHFSKIESRLFGGEPFCSASAVREWDVAKVFIIFEKSSLMGEGDKE